MGTQRSKHGASAMSILGKKRSDANAGTCSDLTKLDGKYSGGAFPLCFKYFKRNKKKSNIQQFGIKVWSSL